MEYKFDTYELEKVNELRDKETFEAKMMDSIVSENVSLEQDTNFIVPAVVSEETALENYNTLVKNEVGLNNGFYSLYQGRQVWVNL